MNVTYEKVSDAKGRVVIAIEEQDYAEQLKKKLKEIQKTVQAPGFRPGHVPMGLVTKKYGKSAKFDVINKEVADKLFDYIKEEKIDIIGQPVPDADPDLDLDKKDFEFAFELALAPNIDIKIDKDITIPYYTIEVTDAMIDEQDQQMRRRMGKQESGDTVDDDAVVKGVITEVDENGNPVEGGLVMENGIVAPKYFKDKAQTEAFVGHHVGDEIIFNPWATCDGNPNEMSSMLGIDKEDVDKYKGNFRFDIKDIIVLVPATPGEEYYEMLFGKDSTVKTEEEYRERIKAMIAGQLAGESRYRFAIDARKVLEDKVGHIDFAEDVLKKSLMIQNEEVTEENIDEVFPDAIKGLEWQLIADKIAKDFELKLTEEDLKNSARILARNEFARYGLTQATDEMVDRYVDDMLKDEKMRRNIANQAFESIVFRTIHDNVTLDNKTVSVEQFNELFKA